MALLNKGLTMIHFDETYYLQKRLGQYAHEDINLMQMEHACLYCENQTLNALEKHLSKRRQKGVTFIGNGNYHYVSYILLKEITKPFTLVLFDNHTDLAQEEQEHKLLSCGSWVSFALRKVRQLQQVVIIGPTSLTSHQLHEPRTTIYPFNGKHLYSMNSILSSIITQNIYISIDKDVLSTSEVETNWDQGVMRLNTLAHFLKFLLAEKEVEGVDICGETLVSPVTAFLPDFQKIVRKNEYANMRILQECLKSAGKQTKGA